MGNKGNLSYSRIPNTVINVEEIMKLENFYLATTTVIIDSGKNH